MDCRMIGLIHSFLLHPCGQSHIEQLMDLANYWVDSCGKTILRRFIEGWLGGVDGRK